MFSKSEKASKRLGEPLARRIEEACGLDRGWLDDENHLPVESTIQVSQQPKKVDLLTILELIKGLSEKERDAVMAFLDTLHND